MKCEFCPQNQQGQSAENRANPICAVQNTILVETERIFSQHNLKMTIAEIMELICGDAGETSTRLTDCRAFRDLRARTESSEYATKKLPG